MLQDISHLDCYRVKTGLFASTAQNGRNGFFILPGPHKRVKLQVMVSSGMDWEHVSVKPVNENRCPTWDEMCYVKDTFWAKDEVVIQYHPAETEYVNLHPFVLHLWMPTYTPLPVPPLIFV